MENLSPPPSLKLNSNPVESWKQWKELFQLYIEMTSLNAEPVSQKVAILLHVTGEECLEIYNTFDEVSSDSLNGILAKFEAYFFPQRNITYECQKLFLLVQRVVREIFRNSLADSKDPYLVLLLYRFTPVLE
ncbi:hypothetical protein AVEN_16947-1 [Araneus ventricosus]|uniref:Uncharacterized protein n=1 Tax=Araneus ventricosus TaxID=182803 RepID=A0A4Y2D4D4_ARAVE|nr:hypothetical protein AVEN_16947-1 [Araneus ventricosus]